MTPKGIKISIAPEIDRDTAELALKVVQTYCNEEGFTILCILRPDGKQDLAFVDLEGCE